ncbi:MAG: hypothetical protein A2169_08440 [Deltaproteobacteria bacterium RBG_13_47_9]|nr:MAG: hypothetical protein A2169_08440 [Deltaproteobacteria bacterium RBG_13_47_9]
MGKRPKRDYRQTPLLIALLLVLLGFLSWALFSDPTIRSYLQQRGETWVRESRRILGWERREIPPEEKRIREEVILKKMEEARTHLDWKSLAPEYPRPKKSEPLAGEEKLKALKNSSEFKELDKDLKEYLRKKEELFNPELPVPSLKDATDFAHLKDKGAEKVVERLLGTKEKTFQERPMEENLLLGIKGPLTTRKILQRPNLPQVKLKVETEIEMILYVLPNGMIDRVIPSVKGDAELERIAVHYLKQWRFAPLPNDQPQVEQWGTIPIKFKLK